MELDEFLFPHQTFAAKTRSAELQAWRKENNAGRGGYRFHSKTSKEQCELPAHLGFQSPGRKLVLSPYR